MDTHSVCSGEMLRGLKTIGALVAKGAHYCYKCSSVCNPLKSDDEAWESVAENCGILTSYEMSTRGYEISQSGLLLQ